MHFDISQSVRASYTDSPSTQGVDSSFGITLSHGVSAFVVESVPPSLLVIGPAGETGFGKKRPRSRSLSTFAAFFCCSKVASRLVPKLSDQVPSAGQARKADERRQVCCVKCTFF